MVEDENKPSRLRSKIMRNKAALKKKRDEEDNRRHKEKEQIKKELKITENKEEKGKNKNESHESIVKKEVKIPSGTTTVNSIPKPETPLSTTDKISEKINPETPSSTDKNEQNDNKRKRYENIETDSTPKKIKIEPK
ncbi:hypothetical protein BCR36DRAFT_339426 [Piromyces finnis]|nr:hypothetical protein BCR36DRAFT_339426 [Piromyces finnis]|eukprot:ORX41467.1 hypothetical protein BCR36DRAFT_339426 [Piromyces finnis]